MESWRNRKTLILSRTDMMGLLTPAEYVSCVEQAYRMHGEGRYYMDPKGHIVLDKYPGEWEAMPSYIEEPDAAACKWVSIRERNREKFDLPTVFSILIYTHPETGFPLAICDGSYHTVMRTGAVGRRLGEMDGAQESRRSLRSSAPVTWRRARSPPATTVFAWDEVRIWSRSQATLDEFVRDQAAEIPSFQIHASRNLEEVVRGADVVVTVTPARGADRQGRMDRARHPHRRGRRRQSGRPGARPAHPAARAHLRRRHPPMPHRRRDQRAAVARGSSASRTSPAKSAKSSPARSRAAAPTMRSRCSIRPASRCRIRRPFRSNTSAPSPPASASRRR